MKCPEHEREDSEAPDEEIEKKYLVRREQIAPYLEEAEATHIVQAYFPQKHYDDVIGWVGLSLSKWGWGVKPAEVRVRKENGVCTVTAKSEKDEKGVRKEVEKEIDDKDIIDMLIIIAQNGTIEKIRYRFPWKIGDLDCVVEVDEYVKAGPSGGADVESNDLLVVEIELPNRSLLQELEENRDKWLPFLADAEDITTDEKWSNRKMAENGWPIG